MAQKSYRLMYRFWLDIAKPDEETIADKIEILKNERSFTQTIRDGVNLIVDLRAGKTDVLFELFPLMKAKLQSSSSGSNDNGNISRDIARLETLILQQGSKPEQPIMKPVSGGLQPLQGFKPLAPPPEDDSDMDLIVTKAVGDGKSASNFLASMNALQQ